MSLDTDTLTDRPDLVPVTTNHFSPYLFILLQCDRLTSGSARYSLADIDEVIIGRGTERAVRYGGAGQVRRLHVHVPDRRVSTMHAVLRRTTHGWEFEDTNSTNGSRVADAKVSRCRVEDGDLIEVGHTFLRLRTALPTPRESEELPPSDILGLATLVPSLAESFAQVSKIASAMVPTLIYGETGSGKDLLARAIHDLSGRSGSYIPVNCGAIAESLVGSQMFGHLKGAFSGAHKEAHGFFRAADRGTLFLDEVAELPMAAQPALLRVLQNGEVMPVGAARVSSVDVRVIAATHRSLRQQVAANQFRADLLARLDGCSLHVPPLRQRMEDVGLLVAAILPDIAGTAVTSLRLSVEAARSVLRHDWPFNIRELRQYLVRAYALRVDNVMHTCVRTDQVGARSPGERESARSFSPDEEALRRTLLELLTANRGNISEVARVLGKARMQVLRWTKRFDLDPREFRA